MQIQAKPSCFTSTLVTSTFVTALCCFYVKKKEEICECSLDDATLSTYLSPILLLYFCPPLCDRQWGPSTYMYKFFVAIDP